MTAFSFEGLVSTSIMQALSELVPVRGRRKRWRNRAREKRERGASKSLNVALADSDGLDKSERKKKKAKERRRSGLESSRNGLSRDTELKKHAFCAPEQKKRIKKGPLLRRED